MIVIVTVLLIIRSAAARKEGLVKMTIQMADIKSEADNAVKAQEEKFSSVLRQKEEEVIREKEAAELRARDQKSLVKLRTLPRGAFLVGREGSTISISMLNVRLGRDRSQSDFIIDDPSVSRGHAIIGFERGPSGYSSERADMFFIWDNGSTNGTFINEKLLPKPGESGHGAQPLRNNDIVRLGKAVFTFQC